MCQKLLWLLSLVWLLSSTMRLTEARYINGSAASETNSNNTEEDVDLEEALSDYYDNLAELLSSELTKEEQEENEMRVETEKLKREGGNISAAVAEPRDLLENKTMNYYDLAVPVKIGNITYRFLNETYAAILDMQRANREREAVEEGSGRIKNMRLNSIKESLLNLRGGSAPVTRMFPDPHQTKTLKEIFERRLRDGPEWASSNMYAEKRQSFYPSCDIPRKTDEDIWADPFGMNLFFDVYFPTPQKDSALMIVNAVLRLYTISQGVMPFMGNVTIPDLRIQMDQTLVQIPNFSLLNVDDEKRIRISVYWHTRALRRQRSKKKLLDSQMMPLYGDHNLTFDIRAAVRSWKKSGQNFGLLVTVEDEYGNLLEPSKYIHPMNCSKWAASVKPLPLFGFDSPAQYFIEDRAQFEERNGTTNETNYDDESSHFSNEPVKYPILGIRMREVTHTEMQNLARLRTAQMELESRYYNLTNRHHQSSGSSHRSEGRSNINSTSRITDFENVPLGSPITRNPSSQETDSRFIMDAGKQMDNED